MSYLGDDKKARELLLIRAQYHMEEGVLYYIETDKTLHLILPAGDHKHLFEEVHTQWKIWCSFEGC